MVDRTVGLGHRPVHVEVSDHPLEDMTQGKELETEVVGTDGRPFRRRQDIMDEVAVGESDSLWPAGGARGVNQGQHIVLTDVLGPLPEEIFRLAGLPGVNHLVECHHSGGAWAVNLYQMFEVGTLVPYFGELRHLLGALRHRHYRTGILDLIGDLRRSQRRVHRHVGCTNIHRRQIDHVPLGTVVGQQHHPIATADPQLFQPDRETRGTGEELGCAQRGVTFERVVEIMLFPRRLILMPVQIEDGFLRHACSSP